MEEISLVYYFAFGPIWIQKKCRKEVLFSQKESLEN